MQSGLVITEDIPINRDRSVRPDQLLNPYEGPGARGGILDYFRIEMMELYSSEQTNHARGVRALFCIPVCIPVLLCFCCRNYICPHVSRYADGPTSRFNQLRQTFAEDNQFQTFLDNLASNNNLHTNQFSQRDIINIWLSWLHGHSDDIDIHSTEEANGEQRITVQANHNFHENSLNNIDTSAIRHRVVSFRDAQTTFLNHEFDAMVSIITPYQLGTSIIVYQRRNPDYIRVLESGNLRDFSVAAENFEERINNEIGRHRQAAGTSPPDSVIEHYLIQDDTPESSDAMPL